MTGPAFLSYLGTNTVPIVRELGDQLGAELGIDLAGELAPSWADILAAIDSGSAHVLWMCGLATTQLIDSGQLDFEIVAAPVFPGESGPVYRSIVVARRQARPSTIEDLAAAAEALSEAGALCDIISLIAQSMWKGELVIIDAEDFAARPVASVQLPRRVPAGLHATPQTAGWAVERLVWLPVFASVLVLSVLMDRLVFRPLRGHSPAVMLVSTTAPFCGTSKEDKARSK